MNIDEHLSTTAADLRDAFPVPKEWHQGEGRTPAHWYGRPAVAVVAAAVGIFATVGIAGLALRGGSQPTVASSVPPGGSMSSVTRSPSLAPVTTLRSTPTTLTTPASPTATSTTPTPTTERVGSTPAPDLDYSWASLPPLPSGFESNGVAVWAADRLVVWGGTSGDQAGDAAAEWVPGNAEWTPIPRAPIDPKKAPVVAALGTEIIVCCGVNASERSNVETAIYSVDTGEWRTASPAPRFGSQASGAIWTGSKLYVLGGLPGLAQFGAYTPSSDTWELLPDPPYESPSGFAITWTGSELLAWPRFDRPGHSPVVFDPADGTWRQLEIPKFVREIDTPSVVWTGNEVIVWGVGLGIANQNEQRGAAWDPVSDTWREIAGPPLPAVDWGEWTPGGQDAVWTGEEMIVWAGTLDDQPRDNETRVLAYQPDSDEWHIAPSLPLGQGGTLIWTGDAVIVFGSSSFVLQGI